MKRLLFFLLVIFAEISITCAQTKVERYQDSLKNLGYIITNDTVQEHRVQANYKFIKTLVEALKERNSFNTSFSSLSDFISIKKSDDSKFRVMTWFVQNNDGTYRYYGALQMNNPNQLELYPLVDNTQNLRLVSDLADTTLATNQWYGAVYYHILPVLGIKDPYYILFGWKGESLQNSGKVIETLSFKDGRPIFGTAVLEDGPKSNHYAKRIVFHYVRDANMMLRYVKDDKLIVFDHLVAQSEQSDPTTNLLAPDLSYDGYKFRFGKWAFQENLKLKNLPDERDDLFIDPSKDSQNTSPVIKE